MKVLGISLVERGFSFGEICVSIRKNVKSSTAVAYSSLLIRSLGRNSSLGEVKVKNLRQNSSLGWQK